MVLLTTEATDRHREVDTSHLRTMSSGVQMEPSLDYVVEPTTMPVFTVPLYSERGRSIG